MVVVKTPSGYMSVDPRRANLMTTREGVRLESDVYRNNRGYSSTFQASLAREAEARRQAEVKARLEEKARLDNEARIQAERAKQRVLELKRKLLLAGNQEQSRILRNQQGQRIRVNIVKNNQQDQRAIIKTNLTTGEISYQAFQRPKGNGYVRQTAGVREMGAKPKEIPEIKIHSKDFIKKTNITLSRDVTNMLNKNKLSQEINRVGSMESLNKQIAQDVSLNKPSKLLSDVADVVSGGWLTENKINKEQSNLNKRIIKFNNKYNGKELGISEFNKAEAEQKFITNAQHKINNKINSLVTSKKNKIRNFYQFLSVQKTPRLTIKQQEKVINARLQNKIIQAEIKRNQPQIQNINNKINNINSQITTLESSKNKNILNYVNLYRLKNLKNNLTTQIARLNYELPPKVLAGTFPIIPASKIPKGISKVVFVGTQKKVKGGMIITDIAFKTKKGGQGLARGVSINKNGKIISITAGKMGRIAVRLPSGKSKIDKLKSFMAVEKTISKPTKFTSESLKRIGNFVQNERKRGLLRVIKSNIQGLEQLGIGKIAVIKGRKFYKPFIRFPSGRFGTKLGKGISVDDFASISAVLRKKDLSAIIGKTITAKKDKSEFIGIIKSLTTNGNKIFIPSGNTKLQYQQALKKVISSVSSAVSKAERTSQFKTKSAILTSAIIIISKTIPTTSSLKLSKMGTTLIPKRITSKKVLTMQQQIIKPKRIVMQKSNILQKQINKVKTKIIQLKKTKPKSKLINKQISNLIKAQKQLQGQLSKVAVKTKMKPKAISIGMRVTPPTITTPIKSIKTGIIPLIIPKTFKRKPLSKKVPVFYVKEKIRGKIIRLTPKPLTLKDAKDFLAYRLDNRLSRSGWFEPLGKAKVVVVPPKNIQGYFNKHSKKFRAFKIRLGKTKKIRMGYIEKRKYFSDRPKERLQLSRSRKRNVVKRKMIKRNPIKKTTIKRVKRKITPQQRKLLLKRLKKARAVRMKNLRKR